MNRNKLGLTGAAVALLMLILDSRAAAEAAAAGVDACVRTVIPALFPFFLLSGYITGSLEGGKLVQLAAKLFHVSPNCGGILLTGLLGGYPVGAKLAAEQYRAGFISKKEADRLIMFCSQAGPSFLFGIAGAQLGGSGWTLWGIQILSALAVAWLVPGACEIRNSLQKTHPVSWNSAMRSALFAMASVCGWVVIFNVVIRFLSRWVLWLLPEIVQLLVCGLLELTNGCLLLSSITDPRLRFLLAVVMLNFGGICVLVQTASVARELDLRGYLVGKLLQTGFALLLALAIQGQFVAVIPLLFVFSLRIPGIFRNRGSNLRKIGV